MYKILVPLDGSLIAEQAIATATLIAQEQSGSLELLLVRGPGPIASSLATTRGEQPVTVEEEYLKRVADRIARESDIPVSVAVLVGEPHSVICRRARKIEAAMIVMTTHGRTGISRAWLGSVADRVVRESDRPVLLVRAREESPAAVSARLSHVLVPLDGSALAEQVIEAVLRQASSNDITVTLLQVIAPIPEVAVEPLVGYPFAVASTTHVDQAATQAAEKTASSYLESLAQKMRKRQPRLAVNTRVLVDDRPARAILDAARDSRADVIAMTTHGRGASRLFVGSIADKLLRASSIPLLVVRAAPTRLRLARSVARNRRGSRVSA